MAILVANIGTSDLAVRASIDSSEYLPIDPLPDEPNLNTLELTEEEKQKWRQPWREFQNRGLYRELGFEHGTKVSSRLLTKRIWDQYNADPEAWHNRLRPVRILGALHAAIALGVDRAYIFVTNQETAQCPEGHEKDTCYLYKILEQWCQREQLPCELHAEIIPNTIPLNRQDEVLGFYYGFFSRLSQAARSSAIAHKRPQKNQIVEGKVVGFYKAEGIFVELLAGGKGLLHINELSQEPFSSQKVGALQKLFSTGDRIKVMVSRQSEDGQLGFSTKGLECEPGEMLHDPKVVYDRTVLSQSTVPTGENLVLVSTKGGTPQMSTALQLQAISLQAVPTSMFRYLLFLEPELSIRRVFQGEASTCQLISYWQYVRGQKYQAVQQLLERWDFDGSLQILNGWQDFLSYLSSKHVLHQERVQQSQSLVEQVTDGLKFAQACFNLDMRSAVSLVANKAPLANTRFGRLIETYYRRQFQNRVLNLYTQCRIFWELDQIAHFLTRMVSFYEAVLDSVIRRILGKKACLDQDWSLDKSTAIEELGRPVWEAFAELERLKNPRFQGWEMSGELRFQISGRFSKRNFIQVLLQHQNQAANLENWQALKQELEALDYWAKKRNALIHSAQGISQERMHQLYANRKPRDITCAPDEILQVMASMSKNHLVGMSTVECNQFIGNDAKHYLYSDVKNWVIEQLLNDSADKPLGRS